MRLFQIKITLVDTMDWIVGSEKYETEYGERRTATLMEAEKQVKDLAQYGIVIRKDAPTVITEKQLTDIAVAQVKYELIREISAGEEQDPTDLNGVMRKFNRMAAKLLSAPALNPPSRNPDTHSEYNERVNIHMPGQALSTYNEVMLMEDTCSDELQTSLDKGWRLIAACPQPGARRPDYILGRFNPEKPTDFAYARRPK